MKKMLLCLALSLLAGEAAAIGRVANVEVFDRGEQRALPVYWHEGRAYVVGRPGSEYRIVVKNRAGADVLAVVSVDGINVVTGETASTQQGGYVIDNRRQVEIAGWRKSLSRTAAFYFTSLGDSYAARTARPDNVGVIGVALFRRKAEPEPMWAPAPRSEDSAARESSGMMSKRAAPQAQLGTGHGRSESSQATYVEFERATAYPEEQVAIYYDSYANLVARGVISHKPRREPDPFPDRFVPDPR